MLIPSDKIYCLFDLKTSSFTVKCYIPIVKTCFFSPLAGGGGGLSASNTNTMSVN